jgi:hypothetical protein
MSENGALREPYIIVMLANNIDLSIGSGPTYRENVRPPNLFVAGNNTYTRL